MSLFGVSFPIHMVIFREVECLRHLRCGERERDEEATE
jgi:hypothetical protein